MRVIGHYEKAIALDSTYAQAYIGLAATQILRAAMLSAELGASDAFTLAKPLLEKGLDIDPTLDEGHTSYGFTLLYNDWDFEGAEGEYKLAIVNDYPDALAVYADYLNFTRRHEEALEVATRLNETNPYYPNTRMILALYHNGDNEGALDFAKSRIELFNNYFTLESYGFVLLNTGQHQEAIQVFQDIIDQFAFRFPRVLGWMGAAYAGNGDREMALTLIDELSARKNETLGGSLSFFMAVIYAALGESEQAIQWLQDAYNNHEMEMPWLISEPQFYSLHEEPEFQELVRDMGFPK